MTKSELKSKMVVEFKNGNRYLVVDDTLVRYNGFNLLILYNDDLTCYNQTLIIEKVFKYLGDYGVDCVSLENMLSSQNLSLIWERPQLKPITKEELAKMGFELINKEPTYETLDELVKRLGLTPSIGEIRVGTSRNKDGFSWVYVNYKGEYLTSSLGEYTSETYPKVYIVRY